MNSAGVISASGNAGVHIGNNSSIIHNHYPTDSRTETDKAKVRTQFLQRLFTSPYEDRKNRNPKRVDGTCEWFTAHRLFQNWRQETSALLWVSADPGCGKSVLARYLVDEILPSSATRTTCYFFFKGDFVDQRVLEGALCCILYQLFIQNPILLTDEILENFKRSGDRLFASFDNLWDTLIRAIPNHDQGEIVCILDALDECVNQTQLTEVLTQHYSKNEGNSRLKFLVTSRPYIQIQRDFQILKESQPTIHLSGESQEEVDKIAQEITLVIKQRVEELAKRLQLIIEEKQILHEELAVVGHRTYLWVYLVFDVIERAVWLTKDELRATIRNLPRTVEEAYNDILLKSSDPDKAKYILHIIVAADRPLYLTEMVTVLTFQAENQRCYKNLEEATIPPNRLRDTIRETCGLFVVIQDSQIFLLHQTAREFLVRLVPNLPGVFSPSLEWQHSLDLKESHRLLSEICIKYLPIAYSSQEALDRTDPHGMYGLLFENYAACYWADHYRQAHNTKDPNLLNLASQLCDTDSPVCLYWLEVYGLKRRQDPQFHKELPTSLLIASYFGLDSLVNLILKDDQTRLDARGFFCQRTALSWASEKGYDLIVQSLLSRVPKRQVIFRDKLIPKSPIFRDKLSSKYPTIVNQKDMFGQSPLWYAVVNGHQHIVQHLLKRGADVNIKDESGLTPLLWAVDLGHNDIVALLLEKGARQNFEPGDLETRDEYGRSPLLKATDRGNEALVRLLLNRGAEVDALDKDGRTPLIYASSYGHNEIVKLLLSNGANINVLDKYGRTPLIQASMRGYHEIVKLLLSSGAEVDTSDKDSCTPLIYASIHGRNKTVELLLNSGARVNALDKNGQTPLIGASIKGNSVIVKLLLDNGAEIDLLNVFGETALIHASRHGHEAVVKLLLDNGADETRLARLL
ncbi:hypothetical protein NUW58_g7392 [Xylaria curta]|uniref:Uncharacterized protein n=1 Tax=Xylaria curta TaxID=42375 RepID=A0ACC1NI58_9PEZI|nr:hypothetical protein NUW58_g7392 [Xylaria curta]